MTTTGVKNAVSVLNNPAASVTVRTSVKTSEVSFQNVWDSRTGKNDQTFAENSVKKTDAKNTGQEEKVRTEKTDNSDKADKTEKTDNVKGSEDVEEAEDIEGRAESKSDVEADEEVTDEKSSGPDTDEALEILMTAVVRIVDTLTETLGISEDELKEILDDKGFAVTDLLEPQKLGEVILEAGGAQDSFALLTNEELYQNFNGIMNELNTVLESDSGIDNQTIEQLKLSFDEQTAVTQTENAEENILPEIEVNVERDTKGQETGKPVTDGKESFESEAVPEKADQADTVSEKAGRNAGEKSSDRHSKGEGHNTNLFLQNIRNNTQEIAVGGTEPASQGETVNTQDIMRQLMDYMKIQVKPHMSNLEMQLHPASLGTIRIQLASNGGAVTANFVTQNEAVKAALENQMVQLKESFAEQGIKVEAIEVTVQTHQFEQNLDQNRNNGRDTDSGAAKSGRTRRIRLDDILSGDDLDEMENEDRIAAEMMEANGGTVDYTV